MPRTVGSLTPSWFSDDMVVRAFYLRMVWGGSIGTLYWTTKQTAPATVDTRNIDGSTRDWDGTKVWQPGSIQEGTQNAYSISDLTFGNEENDFSDLISLGGGIKGVPITVWCAGFNKLPPHAFIDKFVLFDGEGDRAEVSDQVSVAIKPRKHPGDMMFPRRRFDVAHGFNFIPPANFKIQWGSFAYTAPTASPAQTGGAGSATIPVPGARVAPVLVQRRGGTRVVGPRGGSGDGGSSGGGRGGPRTVTR